MTKKNIIKSINNLEGSARLEPSISEVFAEKIANRVLQALQESPGQSYIGGKVIKHRIATPADEESLRKQFRSMIARKFFAKWGC